MLYLNGKETKTANSFAIYADVQVVGTPNSAQNYLFKTDSGNGGKSVTSACRMQIGVAKYYDGGYYMKVWVNNGLNGIDGYLTLDNIVRVAL